MNPLSVSPANNFGVPQKLKDYVRSAMGRQHINQIGSSQGEEGTEEIIGRKEGKNRIKNRQRHDKRTTIE